jgi:SAM-dependent methyltransferase
VIRVLQHHQEVELATQAIQAQNLPTHLTVQKNWDQWLLAQCLMAVDRRSPIIDLGCGDCCTLDFLATLGFQNLIGVDLGISAQVSDRPYQLYQADMGATPFPDCTFEAAVSISVIEHGANLNSFFQEAYRLLRSNGLLFITTDYWQPKIQVDPAIKPFNLPWKIFSHSEIEAMIDLAAAYGFRPTASQRIPECIETTVNWHNQQYTFIALVFRKSTLPREYNQRSSSLPAETLPLENAG